VDKQRPALRIRPRPSRLLAVFLLTTHGTALAVVVSIPLDWYWRAWLAATVLSGLAYTLGAHVLYRVPWAAREANWMSDGTWILTLVRGERIESRLLPSSFVARRLLVLNFRRGRWRSVPLVLLPDTLDADQLRRLRVRLQLHGEANGPRPDPPG
jgi:hypothetical protein